MTLGNGAPDERMKFDAFPSAGPNELMHAREFRDRSGPAVGGFDLGFRGPVTPRPRLGDGGRESGDVKPDGGAGSAMNQAGALSRVRLRRRGQQTGGVRHG